MTTRTLIRLAFVSLLPLTLLLDACKEKHNMTKSFPTFYLDSLTITGSNFLSKLDTTKKQNIVLSYFIGDSTITLHGWILKKGKSGTTSSDTGVFNSTADLLLTPIGKTTTSIGPNIHLSNQVILGKITKNIIKAIRGKQAILYFIPGKNAKTAQINYRIKIKIIGDSSMITAGETFSSNPSPPHQAFD